ncbi:histone deacetylase family protein [Candidatus Dependentiae bacterium]|nr:histone deacetylase family protein [Candidatus Dependentiae bacterium]
MKTRCVIINNLKHTLHNPLSEVYMQQIVPYSENSKRAENIFNEISKLKNIVIKTPVRCTRKMLFEIHSADYINYIKQISGMAIDEDDYRTPYVIPLKSKRSKLSTSKIDNVADYSMDVTTPIGKFTYQSAVHSADIAYTGAQNLIKGEKIVYSLCRPPGHHAEQSRCGGYCYINNAAIAASFLSKQSKVTLLDIDYHHGNGSQEIFYNRNDVQYISIHANPKYDYPYYTGFSDETGAGKGKRFNLNIPLEKNTSDKQYLSALNIALNKILKFNPGFLLVSLGVDTYENDPVGGFKLSKNVFQEIGQNIFQLNLPTLIIQEGGYNTSEIGLLVKNFLKGFGIK